MKNLKLTFFVTVIFLLAAWFSAEAQMRTNVRGKIMINNGGRQAPVPSAKVDLYSYNAVTKAWGIVATTYTDGYGFYYFKSIAVGYYSLQVNGSKNFNVQVIAIDTTRFVYQDFPIFFL